MTINKTYSHGDFTDQTFTDRPAKEFNDTEIVGSCFYQQAGTDTVVFPADMKGVTFRRCNLDNVLIPSGCTVAEDCCTKRIMAQPLTPKATKDDGDYTEGAVDWFVDKDNKPTEPMDKRRFTEEGRSQKPEDIPAEHVIEVEMSKAEYEAITEADFRAETAKGGKPLTSKAAWFKGVPEVISDNGKTVVVRGKAWLKRGEKKTDIRPRVEVAK